MARGRQEHFGHFDQSHHSARAEQSHANAEAHREGAIMYRLTGDRDFLQADAFYTTTFTTLNGSGVTGEAIIGFDKDSGKITVAISAEGLEANQVHIQHIHGFTDDTTDSRTPTDAQDTDGDGFVELAEGLTIYGDILLNLTTNHENGTGGDNGHDHSGDLTGFPTSPDGTIWFVESYQLPAGSLDADPKLDLREVVIHGMSLSAEDGIVNGMPTDGEVNGTPGYKLVLPVASGELEAVGSYSDFQHFLQDTDFAADAQANGASIGNTDMFFG